MWDPQKAEGGGRRRGGWSIGADNSLLWRREGDGPREREILRQLADDLLGRLRRALELFDLRECVAERGLSHALARIGVVEELFLCAERSAQAPLFVARGEPGVNDKRRQ